MDKATLSGSEFIIKLEGIKLPAATEKRIAEEMQRTFLQEVAKIDFKADISVRIPRKDWLGIWLERIRNLPSLPSLRTTSIGR